jgi:hypothetical protein
MGRRAAGRARPRERERGEERRRKRKVEERGRWGLTLGLDDRGNRPPDHT